MAILKIRDKDGNFIELLSGVEEVSSLPEISDSNKNKILRYNGDIYAVAMKEVETPIAVGDDLKGKKIKIDLPIFMKDYSTTISDHKQIFVAGSIECYIKAHNNHWDASDTKVYGDEVYIGDEWVGLYSNDYYVSHSKVWSYSEYAFPDDTNYVVTSIDSSLNSYSSFKILEDKLVWNKISYNGKEKEYDYFWIKGSGGTQIYLKYKFEKGMNWNDFINSEYNIDDKFRLDGGSSVFWTSSYSVNSAGGITYLGTEYQEIRPGVYEVSASAPEPS